MDETVRKIHKAILADDVKTLSAVFKERRYLTLSFGRFPVLSLAYMYDAKKTIKTYSVDLRAVSSYEYVEEFPEDYTIFKSLAGKALRLYANRVVSPAEIAVLKGYNSAARTMLADNKTDKEATAVAELYRVKESRTIRDKDGNVTVPRGRIPASVLIVTIIVLVLSITATGLTAYAYKVLPELNGNGLDRPFSINSTPMLTEIVASEKAVACVLGDDIRLSAPIQNEILLDLDGNGHTIFVEGKVNEPLFSTVSGTLKNLTVVYENITAEIGSDKALVAKEVTGTLSGVTVKVNAKTITLNGNGAIVAYKNSGICDNVTVNLNGTINEVSGSEKSYFGCLFATNSGKITNSTVNLDVKLKGDAESVLSDDDAKLKGDYLFSGLVGENNAIISSSVVNGSIEATAVDIAGVVVNNAKDGSVTACVNNATVTQRSASARWNPNVAGIAYENYGKLNACVNNGTLTAVSDQTTTPEIFAIATGIVATNYETVENCTNNGALKAQVNYGCFRLSGIASQSLGVVNGSINRGTITGVSAMNNLDYGSAFSYAGGIVAENYSIVSSSINYGDIDVSIATSCLYAGGISAYNLVTTQSKETAGINASGAEFKLKIVSSSSTNWLFLGGLSGYFTGNLTSSFTAVTVEAPTNERIYADALCGAVASTSFKRMWYINDCCFLKTERSGVGVAAYSVESQTVHSITPISQDEAYTKDIFNYLNECVVACNTMEELKSMGVYRG